MESLFFEVFAGKDLPRALQTDAFVAIVYGPGPEAKVAAFKVPLALNSVVLPAVPVRLDSFQPTSNKLADCRVDIPGLFLLREDQS